MYQFSKTMLVYLFPLKEYDINVYVLVYLSSLDTYIHEYVLARCIISVFYSVLKSKL